MNVKYVFNISRSGFQRRKNSDTIDCGILGPSWHNKNVDPKRKVLCGSYELFLRNAAHQMNEKVMFENFTRNNDF